MKPIAFFAQGLWWAPVIVAVLAFLVWQRRRMGKSPLRWGAFLFLLLALLNPIVLFRLDTVDKAEFSLQLAKPRILLAEYGGGKSFLGTVLGSEALSHTDVVSPEDIPVVADMAKRYDIVVLHAAKNFYVYMDYFTDWRSFPNRGKLESLLTEYGVVFDSGTNTLPQDLDHYGLVVLAGADIKPEEADRLLAYVERGGRLLLLFHAGGGLAINAPGNENPYCILYHHPPYGDRPFPEDWLQRNLAAMLRDRLGVQAMENISCIYGKLVVQQSDVSALAAVYGKTNLYPSVNIDGKDFDKLDWTTAFLDYDPAWQPVLTVDTNYSGEPRGHGTPIPVPVQGRPAGIARQYGNGRVFVLGFGPVNYGRNGINPSLLLAAAPYIAADVSYGDPTYRALMTYVSEGGNLVVVGPNLPKAKGNAKLTDLLPVNVSGPLVSEATKAVFRNPSHPLLADMAPFAISHYRVTSGKATGDVLAADGKNNPVVVTSYYGLGKVAYYLPEIPIQASLDNTAPPEFWRRLVYWLSPQETETPGLNTKLPLRPGDQVPVSLYLRDDQGKPVEQAEVTVKYTSTEGVALTRELAEAAGGEYAGLLALSPGEYWLSFDVRSGTAVRTPQIKLTVASSGLDSLDQRLLKGIAFLGGYQGATPLILPLPLWQLLVLLGVILLCADWAIGIVRSRQ